MKYQDLQTSSVNYYCIYHVSYLKIYGDGFIRVPSFCCQKMLLSWLFYTSSHALPCCQLIYKRGGESSQTTNLSSPTEMPLLDTTENEYIEEILNDRIEVVPIEADFEYKGNFTDYRLPPLRNWLKPLQDTVFSKDEQEFQLSCLNGTVNDSIPSEYKNIGDASTTLLDINAIPDSIHIVGQLRNLTTVNQVWEEYTTGINGQPSIKSLDELFGVRWRDPNAQRLFYHGRRKIYDYIINEINNGKSEQDAVSALESFRIQKQWELSQLQCHLKQIAAAKKVSSQEPIPTFKQSRNLVTVFEAWQEYAYGFDGNPSVKSMDEKYKSIWRMQVADRHHYSRRKKLYSAIQKLIDGGMPEFEALKKLETIRLLRNWTLFELQNNIESAMNAALDTNLWNPSQLPVLNL